MTQAANGSQGVSSAQPELDFYGADDGIDADSGYEKQAPTHKNKSTVTAVAVSILVVLCLLFGGGIWWFMDYTADDGLIYSNVTAAGIDLGGMTPEQAKAAVLEATDGTYTQQSLTVNLPDTSLALSPADTGAALDADRLVEAAFHYGRGGNRWENTMARKKAASSSHQIALEDYLTLNTDFIRQQVDALGQNAASSLTQPSVSVTGEMPALDRTISEALSDESVVHMSMTVVTGTPERSLDTDALYETILNAYYNNDFSPISAEYAVTQPDAIDVQVLYETHCVAPTDAILDEQTYHITPEVLGYGFNTEDLQAQLDTAQPGQEITCEFSFIDAELTLLDLEKYLFQDVLASFSSNHTAIANRTNNLVLACKAIDGTIIRPGETFSFNKIVGERTAEKGYKAATVYTAGKSEPQLGGGICQVASTIYYCTLIADLEIVERGPHQFMVDYVPRGMDATIYWGSKDFKFRNNTNYPIKIYASTHDGQCHIKLYGTDDKDYYVKMTYNTVSGPTGGETEYEEFTSNNNPKGYKDGEVIQTAYSGYVIDTFKNKYDKQTDKLISTEKEARSTFNSRPRIVAKLVKTEAENQPPKETTPPATQPPATEPPATQPPETQPPTEAPTQPPTEATDPPASDGG